MRMQAVKFKHIEEFLEFLPEQELRITLALRRLVLECMPMVREKLSYNVPYYSLNKSICFIWPAAVLWGKKPTYEGVRFGFTKGYLMEDEIGYLEKGTRKQVFWRDFKTMQDIDFELLRAYIFEAIMIDEAGK